MPDTPQELFNWTELMHAGPRGTMQDLCKQPSTLMGLATLIAYLKERPPQGILSDLHELEQGLRNNFPQLYNCNSSAIDPQVSSGKILLEVHVNDTIKLRAKSKEALPLLEKCGQWWKIMSATVDRWYLRSLSRKEQGLSNIASYSYDNLWLYKQDDLKYEIVKVVSYPTTYNHKEHG